MNALQHRRVAAPKAVRSALLALLATALLGALPATARADGGRAMPQPVPAAYTQECA